MPQLERVHSRAAPPVSPAPGMDDEAAAAAARAVVRLFERWRLTDADACTLLGGIAPRTWSRWKGGEPPRLSRDLRARLSNLLGIHKALGIVFTERERGYRWIGTANEAFADRSALDVMRGGELTDLMRVRRYLDAERGGW